MLPRGAYVAPGDLDSPDLQRFLLDPKVDLAPDTSLGTAVLARVLLAFALALDPGSVHCPAVQCGAMS